uniref:Transmembrane protein 18 n=1 Tax=Eptatretus burgeri TaxID=7764 RepID=A0A8C4QWX6_EPTBU
MADGSLQISSLWDLLMSVDWTEGWLLTLLGFHSLCLILTFASRQHRNVQTIYFLCLLALAYSASYINEIAAIKWRSFSKHQYFDAHGVFISLVFSVPLLINAVIILVMWLISMTNQMVEVTRLRIQRQQKPKDD